MAIVPTYNCTNYVNSGGCANRAAFLCDVCGKGICSTHRMQVPEIFQRPGDLCKPCYGILAERFKTAKKHLDDEHYKVTMALAIPIAAEFFGDTNKPTGREIEVA